MSRSKAGAALGRLRRGLRGAPEGLMRFCDLEGRHEHRVLWAVTRAGHAVVFDEVRGWPPLCLAVLSVAGEPEGVVVAQALADEYAARGPGEALCRAVSAADVGLEHGAKGGDGGGEDRPAGQRAASAALG